MPDQAIARVNRAIEHIRAGRLVILVDDEDRENEGDLTMAAELVTPEAINFMAKWGRGLICLTVTEERADALDLPLQRTRRGGPPLGTAFTVSIEARNGVSTGISAADRAHTIRTAVAREARPEDLITPGHVFPLRAKAGGVLVRSGQTEGSVDLARLAGLEPAGVICEIMNDDGSMARMPDLERFAADHDLMILSIADLIQYRLSRESMVVRAVEGELTPTLGGMSLPAFRAVAFKSVVDRTEYLALVLGEVGGRSDVLVRAQTACFPGDVFGSTACDCGSNLRAALRAIEAEGCGVLLYVFPGGRHSLIADIEGHVLHRQSAPTAEVREGKLREFGMGAQALAELGVRGMRLLTNNPRKIVGLEGYGITVVDRVPLHKDRGDAAGRVAVRLRSVGTDDEGGTAAPTGAGTPAGTPARKA